MLEGLTKKLIKRPWLYLTIYTLIILGFALLSIKLQIDSSLDRLVPEQGEYNSNEKILEVAYHQNTGFIVFLESDQKSILKSRPGTLDSEEVRLYTESLKEILLESQYVLSVSDLELTDDKYYGSMRVAAFVPNKVGSVNDVEQEIQNLLVQAGHPPAVKVTLTGFTTLLNRIAALLILDNLKTILLTLGLVLCILWWYFKDLKLALIGVSSPFISLILLAAGMVILDINVTITLAAVGVLMLGLGVDYSIHVMIAYERHLREGLKAEKAILLTFHELGLPILASFITTLAGFAALMLGLSPSSQDQGAVLGLGIAIVFLVTIFVLPVLLVLFDRHAHKKNKVFEKVQNSLGALAAAQAKHPMRVIGIVAIITIVMFAGLMQVRFSTSNSNWIPDDDPVSLSFRQYDYEFGDVDTLQVVIRSTKGDLRDVQTVRDLQNLKQKIVGISSVESVSFVFEDVALERARIEEVALANKEAFNRDFTLTTIQIVSQEFDQDDEGNAAIIPELKEILEQSPIYHAETSLFGDVLRFKELQESLQSDTAFTSLISFFLVFFVSSVIYLSIVVGFTALFPIIIGVLWALGLMGYFNVPFTSLSSGIVALVMGIGVDFSIHLVNSAKHFLAKGESIQRSITHSLQTTGSAILLSSVTTFLGFMALSFATLLGTRRLGWSLGLAIISVFVVSLMLVPSILSLQQKRKGKLLKKVNRI